MNNLSYLPQGAALFCLLLLARQSHSQPPRLLHAAAPAARVAAKPASQVANPAYRLVPLPNGAYRLRLKSGQRWPASAGPAAGQR